MKPKVMDELGTDPVRRTYDGRFYWCIFKKDTLLGLHSNKYFKTYEEAWMSARNFFRRNQDWFYS